MFPFPPHFAGLASHQGPEGGAHRGHPPQPEHRHSAIERRHGRQDVLRAGDARVCREAYREGEAGLNHVAVWRPNGAQLWSRAVGALNSGCLGDTVASVASVVVCAPTLRT